MNLKKFVKERNEALLSLDRKKIEKYCRKYGVDLPAEDETFWAGVHKSRLEVAAFSDEVRRVSRDWLREHGFCCREA